MKITDTMVLFWRTKDIYSNWYPASFFDAGASTKFANTEQHMMWAKAMLFQNIELAMRMLKVTDPAELKQMGREVQGYDDAIWSKHRLHVVTEGNFLKFSQNPELGLQLLATGDRLIVEASPVDLIWGIGLAEDDPRCLDQRQWQGQNLLGKALMTVRDRLRTPINRLRLVSQEGAEDGFKPELSGYAAHEAARVLLENWEAALADGSKDNLVADIDDVISELKGFRQHARSILPRESGGERLAFTGKVGDTNS